jgi:hypothetical protein
MSNWGPHFGSQNVTTHFHPPPTASQPSPTSQSGKQKQETPKQKLEISSRSPESGGNSTKKPRANVNIPIMAWQEESQQLSMGSSSDGGYSSCFTQRLLVILWGPVHPNRYGRELSKRNMTAAAVVVRGRFPRSLLLSSPNELCHLTHLLVPTNSTDC